MRAQLEAAIGVETEGGLAAGLLVSLSQVV